MKASGNHAEILLQRFGIDSPEQIDVEAIAYCLGVVVRFRPLDDCEARIVGSEDKGIITVDSQTPWGPRKRFSIGHELGHWVYHRNQTMMCSSADIGGSGNRRQNPNEKNADRFSAHLLMPRYLLLPAINKAPRLTWKLVDTIATLFSTSRLATAIRLIESNIFPALLICHRQASERAWFTRAHDIPSRWFPRNQIQAESVALDVLYGETEHATQTTSASTWFERREGGRYELFEESIRTPFSEALTIISITDDAMLDDY